MSPYRMPAPPPREPTPSRLHTRPDLATGVAVLLAALYACVEHSPPVLAPQPAAADCVAERTKQQLECVQRFPDDPSIRACQEAVRVQIDCTKDAGGQ